MAVRRIAMLTVVAGFALCGCESQTGTSDENTLPPDAIADLNAWDPGVRDPGYDPGVDPGADPGADDLGTDDGDSGPVADPGTDMGSDPGTDPGGGTGQVSISPGLVDFGYVRLGESANSTIRVLNVGTGTLALSRFRISGTSNVVADLEPEGVVTADGTTYEPAVPIEVAPGDSFDVTLTFSPVSEAALEGEFRVWTDDSAHPDGIPIFLIGNRKRACIRVIPPEVDFGIVTVGAVVDVPVQIESCGQLDLTVSAITLDVPGSEGEAGLSLDFAEFPGGTAPSSSPVTIPSGTRETFRLWYAPQEPSPTGAGGIPQPLDAQVAVASNAFSGDRYVPVSAAAVSTPCAVPVIDVVEDGDLFVGDVIHLSGSRSVSPFAAVDSWMWSVEGPPGAPAAILPYAAQPDVLLPLGAAGTYTVLLQVGDADGNPSCSSAEVSLTAIPALRALVALSWRPASGVAVQPFLGPDADLHVLHPNAAGPDRDDDGQPDGWYDDPWDCYWFNPSPDKAAWGSSDLKVDDRVELVETSEDGLIPEVVRIGMACPAPRTYRIGVHFYDDGGLGPVDAEVHVWDGLGGGVSTGVRLSESDLWEAATLACPAGMIATPSSPVIKKDYVVDVAGGAR
jgi:hypothetical protein